MACGSCQKRRQMIAEARRKAGVRGVIKASPAIVRDTIKNPPRIGKKR
ncbi:hypothetical protein IWQ49_006385 [Labrenzia sp. EL_126]|nr:hypothetical protein [Labrenzia sp. EL_126]